MIETKEEWLRNKSRAIAADNRRGIYAVRRPLHRESVRLLHEALPKIEPDVVGKGRVFAASSLAVSVIAHKRYTDKYKASGKPMREIAKGVPSTRRIVTATLGKLVVAGSGDSHKLAIDLISPQLEREKQAFGTVFDSLNFPLQDDPNGAEEHCSVVLLFSDFTPEFDDPVVLDELAGKLGIAGLAIKLSPPNHL